MEISNIEVKGQLAGDIRATAFCTKCGYEETRVFSKTQYQMSYTDIKTVLVFSSCPRCGYSKYD